MRRLTQAESRILNSCARPLLKAKASLCLRLGLDGGPVEPSNRTIAGIGQQVPMRVQAYDETGLLCTHTITVEETLFVGVGIFNWWAKVVMVPCRPNTNTERRIENVHPEEDTRTEVIRFGAGPNLVTSRKSMGA